MMRLNVCLMALLTTFAPAWAGESGAIALSETNCVLGFEVPSTWHLVKGEVKKLSGWARCGRLGDLSTLRGEIEVVVAALATGNEDRDRKMREFCLEAGRFPKISFALEGGTVSEAGNVVLSGRLTIRDVTRRFVLGAQYNAGGDNYQIIGGGELKWPDFGVRDPSTFFGKLQPNLKVVFQLTLPRN